MQCTTFLNFGQFANTTGPKGFLQGSWKLVEFQFWKTSASKNPFKDLVLSSSHHFAGHCEQFSFFFLVSCCHAHTATILMISTLTWNSRVLSCWSAPTMRVQCPGRLAAVNVRWFFLTPICASCIAARSYLLPFQFKPTDLCLRDVTLLATGVREAMLRPF